MISYRELASQGISTRVAARLVGIPRATATRKPRNPVAGPAPVPANKIADADAERGQILDIVNSDSDSDSFAGLPPIRIYARLLDAGTYLCSKSTMHRVWNENKQVKDRRPRALHCTGDPRAGGHRPRPGRLVGHHQTRRPVKGKYFDAYVMIDISPVHRRRVCSRFRIGRIGGGDGEGASTTIPGSASTPQPTNAPKLIG